MNQEVTNIQKLSTKKRAGQKMIKAFTGDIFKFINEEQLDTLINAANGVGPMGRGIAGAIKKYGGKEIQTEAFKVCRFENPLPGGAYKTDSGRLFVKGIERIIHAVTMKEPGGPTSLDIIEQAFNSALKMAEKQGSLKIGCTALGTGVGGLDPSEVAVRMFKTAKKYISKMDIVFVDLNNVFINKIIYFINNDNIGQAG